jgi:hypothetical protein
LINRALVFEFAAEIDHKFAESGVFCMIDLPFSPAVGEIRTLERVGT